MTEKTLLVEEGGTNTEVFIALRGSIKYYRRMPGHRKINVKDKMPIVGITEEFVASNAKEKKPVPAFLNRTGTIIPDDKSHASFGNANYLANKKLRD